MKNNKPDIALIRKYLNGELDARAMYELERLAQDDPYLMDVMAGMEMSNAVEAEADLLVIDQMIKERIGRVTNRRMIPWKSWSIAASVVLGVSIAGLLFLREPAGQPLTNAEKQAVHTTREKADPSAPQKEGTVVNQPVILKNLPAGDEIAAIPSKQKTDVKYSRAELRTAAEPVVADAAVLNPAVAVANVSVIPERDSGILSKASADNLNDVAVVGYGAAKRPLAQEALAGRVAGVQIAAKRLSKGKATVPVSGVVTDAEANLPLAGVAIKADKSNAGTSTDANGKFTIIVPPETDKLQIASLGYENKMISISGRDSLRISLEPDKTSLNEVVVTGYGQKAEKAHPVTGWKAYRAYLKKNATINDGQGGKVTIAFTVSSAGHPANLRIVEGAGDLLNQKATELILHGPRWIGDSDGKEKEIILKINFKK